MFRIGKIGLLLGILVLAVAVIGVGVTVFEPNVAAQSSDNSGLMTKGLGL